MFLSKWLNLRVPAWLWTKEKKRRYKHAEVKTAAKREHYRGFFKNASSRKSKRVMFPENDMCEKMEIDSYE